VISEECRLVWRKRRDEKCRLIVYTVRLSRIRVVRERIKSVPVAGQLKMTRGREDEVKRARQSCHLHRRGARRGTKDAPQQCHPELEFCWCEVNRKQDTAGAGRLKGEVEWMILHYFVRAVSIDRVLEREALPMCVSRRTCRRMVMMLRVQMRPLTWMLPR